MSRFVLLSAGPRLSGPSGTVLWRGSCLKDELP